MYQAPAPAHDNLPAPRTLLRSTIIALAIALTLLITVVLPAEYGVDPTGVGQLIGLKRMGEIKVALALEAEADAAADAAALAAEEQAAENFAMASDTSLTSDQPLGADNVQMAELVLQPDEGGEIKLAMTEGGTARYEWWTLGGNVNFDLHTDRPNPPGGSHSYAKGQNQASDEGELTAAFDGLHGWFWRNRTSEVVTITLRVEGDFQELRRMP
jgi:hypothetical protein